MNMVVYTSQQNAGRALPCVLDRAACKSCIACIAIMALLRREAGGFGRVWLVKAKAKELGHLHMHFLGGPCVAGVFLVSESIPEGRLISTVQSLESGR